MIVQRIRGDLLDIDVDAIVNPWNRNVIPWWLLIPQGVSGAIKRRAGLEPFRELARHGPMALGSAAHTSAGRLPYQGIVHVAGIDMFWRASPRSVVDSARNAVRCAERRGYRSLALPLIGAGSGGFDEERSEELLLETLIDMESMISASVVRFARR
ncbi:MAG: macro domain-containing protein [Polyangiales bacterium]